VDSSSPAIRITGQFDPVQSLSIAHAIGMMMASKKPSNGTFMTHLLHAARRRCGKNPQWHFAMSQME
jgi:hypothetical protein